jgi:hypothetical protein
VLTENNFTKMGDMFGMPAQIFMFLFLQVLCRKEQTVLYGLSENTFHSSGYVLLVICCIVSEFVCFDRSHPVVFNNAGKGKGKGKEIPLQLWTGPEGFRSLRLPDFKTDRHTKVVRLSALRTGCLYRPGNILGTRMFR